MPTTLTPRGLAAFFLWAGLVFLPPGRPAAGQAKPPGAGRQAWTTSRIQGSPEAPLPYITERAFPSLGFTGCLDISPAPGTDRLFVVEQAGKIYSFRPRADVKAADLAVDLARAIPGVQQTYALAFHPQFEKNRYCYVCYVKAPDQPDGTHIARFRVNMTEPPTIDPASETTIVTWLSGGHNGCCLKFGPDGYLYISTGDGGPANPPDPLHAGQDLGNLLSAILRIDVDHADAGRNYRIPADNPFVSRPGARGEIWAYGLRNPWRMSFDGRTGDLWVGDVGWERWEMLDRIERGGNYGWAVMEGRQPTHPEWTRGPTPILPPTIDHPHSESSSITDGLTYYGTRLKELYGTHIYGDYDTGKFWGFRYVDGKVVDHRELADTTLRVVGFGADRDGEFYVLDHSAGTIHRLVPNPRAGRPSAFPTTLGATGLFADVAAGTPAPGVLSYAINAEPWEDHAVADRLVAIPGTAPIKAEGEAWTYPSDSVLVKTLALEMTRGDRSTRRRIETQILHFDGIDWQPYSYRWNDDQTDATLVGPAGAERTLDVADAEAPGGTRRQTWRFAGRAECQRCHNKWSGPPLAFQAAQLNRATSPESGSAPQLESFARIGLIDRPIAPKSSPRLVGPKDPTAPVDERARAYLHANCAHCHRMHAGSAVLSKMTFDLPLDKTDMRDVRPTQGTFNLHDARVIAPGDPERSVLFYRTSKLGSGRMPYIGSTEVDREGLALIARWISEMPSSLAADPVSLRRRASEQADLERLSLDGRPPAEAQAQAEALDRLLSTTHGALVLLGAIDAKRLAPAASALAVQKGTQHSEASVRDLFERFLPPSQRLQRLGATIDPGRILTLAGDPARGRQVFFNTQGVACKNCHRIGRDGVDLGPELTAIGKKYDRAGLLESILEPSKRLDPPYVTYLAETQDGRVLSGLLVERNEREVVLKDAQNQVVRLPRGDVAQLVTQQQSLMPELLLRDLTAQQVADLLAYLGSLR